jgi:hypothetical protein
MQNPLLTEDRQYVSLSEKCNDITAKWFQMKVPKQARGVVKSGLHTGIATFSPNKAKNLNLAQVHTQGKWQSALPNKHFYN